MLSDESALRNWPHADLGVGPVVAVDRIFPGLVGSPTTHLQAANAFGEHLAIYKTDAKIRRESRISKMAILPRTILHIVYAAAKLQPYVGDRNAYNWLIDTNRSSPVYDRLSKRLTSRPVHFRLKNQRYFYEDEIDRSVDDLIRTS